MTHCPRQNCKNEAVVSRQFGVLPCQFHQDSDAQVTHGIKGRFANVSQLHRVQEQQDQRGGDLVQPYMKGKANPDFFKLYPDRIDDYGVREELARI